MNRRNVFIRFAQMSLRLASNRGEKMSMHGIRRSNPVCNERFLTLISSRSDLIKEPHSELNEGSDTSGTQAKEHIQKQEVILGSSDAKVRLNGKDEEEVDGKVRVDGDLYLLNL